MLLPLPPGLDDLIALEDAIEAHGQFPGGLEEYVRLWKPSRQPEMRTAWLTAAEVIKESGTIRKALNRVRKAIDAYR